MCKLKTVFSTIFHQPHHSSECEMGSLILYRKYKPIKQHTLFLMLAAL